MQPVPHFNHQLSNSNGDQYLSTCCAAPKRPKKYCRFKWTRTFCSTASWWPSGYKSLGHLFTFPTLISTLECKALKTPVSSSTEWWVIILLIVFRPFDLLVQFSKAKTSTHYRHNKEVKWKLSKVALFSSLLLLWKKENYMVTPHLRSFALQPLKDDNSLWHLVVWAVQWF